MSEEDIIASIADALQLENTELDSATAALLASTYVTDCGIEDLAYDDL